MKDNGFPALFRHGRALNATEGPAMGGKLFHLPDWGRWSDRQRLAFLRNAAESYGQDPRMREFVIRNVLKHGSVRDFPTQAAACLAWVQRNVAYYNETREQLQSPWYTLEKKYGDCDDVSLLLASMYECLRLPWRYVLSGIQKSTGQKVRWIEGQHEPPGVKWGHIYVMVGWPPFKPQTWQFADGTLRTAPLGWDAVSSSGGGLGDLGVPMSAAAGEMSWRQIGVWVTLGVVTSVASQLLLDIIRERRKAR